MIENVENKDILTFETQVSVLDEKKVIGSFNKNFATIELLNPENKYSNLKGTEINTIKGTFYVNDVTPVQEEIKVKLDCYDLSYKFDDEYDASKYTFPMTVKEWLVAICDNVGVSYSGYDFPNCEKTLETQPYVPEKSTNRYVVKMIAQAAGSWAVIDSNTLVIRWFDDTDDTKVKVNDWFELSTENLESNPVNLVVIGRGDVEDNLVYPSEQPLDPKEIRIDSNEILELDRNSMIVPIYNQVQGFKYTVYNVKTDGRLNAKVGNKIEYLDNNLKTHESYIMTHTLTFLGGDYTIDSNWQSTFSAEELDETNTDYKFAETIEQKTDRTERLANKLDGIISDVVEQVGTYDSKISTVEQSVSEIRQEVSSKVDLTRESTGTKTITLDNCMEGKLWELTLKGDMVPVFPCKDLYPSPDLFLKPATFYLINTYTVDEEEKEDKYILPFDYISNQNGIYDEFNIDSDGNCTLLRRIGLDEHGDRYVLSNPYTKDCGKLDILLHEGTNKLTIDYYSPIIDVKYAVKSELTETFATKVEMNSSIDMTESQIMSEVNKKVDDADFGTKIVQNSDSVQIAWNQIGENIKIETDDNQAEINTYDESNNLLMSLNKNGQEFYRNRRNVGSIGLRTVSVKNDNDYTTDYYGIVNYINSNSSNNGNGSFIEWTERLETEEGSEVAGTIMGFYGENYLTGQEKRIVATYPMYVESLYPLELVQRDPQVPISILNPDGNPIFEFYRNLCYSHVPLNIAYKDAGVGDTNGPAVATISNSTSSQKQINYLYWAQGGGSTATIRVGSEDYVDLVPNTSYVDQLVASDISLKKNIKNSDKKALDDISKINIRQFDWKENDKHDSVGFIAQEVQQIDSNYVKECITKDDKELLGLNLKSLLALAIKGIQEQQVEIDKLKAEIKELKKDEY